MGLSHPNLIYLFTVSAHCFGIYYAAPLFIFAFNLYVYGGGNKKFPRTALLSSLLMGDEVMDGKILLFWLLFG